MAAPTGCGPVPTTCPYCGVGCGILASVDESGAATIAGDVTHPASQGRLCDKGLALGNSRAGEERLLFPLVHGQRSTWSRALDHVAAGLKGVHAQHGPEAIAFYLSGQMLTEDLYVANKFAKGFLGTPNVDANTRLGMASAVSAHRRAFGADTMPGIHADLDEADLIVLAGANPADCHPVLFERIEAARRLRGTRIVCIDPRRTPTSLAADLHLAIRPGSDTVLFAWLLTEIFRAGCQDDAYLAAHVSGVQEALARAGEIAHSLEQVALRTGLGAGEIETFCAWFLATARTVTCFSQGINQSAQGTGKVNAIINCHLATGRIGKPGAGPLSLAGQSNAMGVRDVGSIANMLAAHMGYAPTEIDRVRRFWAAPRMAERPGLKAVSLFEAIEAGRIRALWIMHANPAASLPRADAFRTALRKLDLLVVSDAFAGSDTVRSSPHVLLPSAAWGEKEGTLTSGQRLMSRQRAFRAPPGEARPDWQHICGVARRLGYGEAFDFTTPADIFREHAMLSDFENRGTRDFDIGALKGISDEDYATLPPTFWPHARQQPRPRRFFAEGGFFTPDGRARMVCLDTPASVEIVDEDWPFRLNTGRLRAHWHALPRQLAKAAGPLAASGPAVSLCPTDAARLGLAEGSHARLASRHGEATFPVHIDAGLSPGQVFVPLHWSDAHAGQMRIGAVVDGAADPHSGQPALKETTVAIMPVTMVSEGLMLLRRPASLPAWLWHLRTALPGGMQVIRFASPQTPRRLHGLLVNYLGDSGSHAAFADVGAGDYRTVALDGGRLVAGLFVMPRGNAALFAWVLQRLEAPLSTAAERRLLLAGHPAAKGLRAAE